MNDERQQPAFRRSTKCWAALLPGKLTVVIGATGIGKTQLGLSYAAAGVAQEGQRGVLFDMTSRGDSQNHREYARRMFDWDLSTAQAEQRLDKGHVWDRSHARRDAMHLFEHAGRRVTADDMDSDAWRLWKSEQIKKLDRAIAFFYGNFIHGVRRVVIDGVEPVDEPPNRSVRTVRIRLSTGHPQGTRLARPRPLPRRLSSQRRSRHAKRVRPYEHRWHAAGDQP